ncbi:MAG: hypothetical protein NZ601_05735, partial [candidate division WOR-3 bacterium]|nr:hypothetical protein [candidate division WOR-3 bacterium]
MKDWKTRVVKPEEALRAIKSGNRVFIGSACGVPRSLIRALSKIPAEDIEITQILNLGIIDYTHEV